MNQQVRTASLKPGLINTHHTKILSGLADYYMSCYAIMGLKVNTRDNCCRRKIRISPVLETCYSYGLRLNMFQQPKNGKSLSWYSGRTLLCWLPYLVTRVLCMGSPLNAHDSTHHFHSYSRFADERGYRSSTKSGLQKRLENHFRAPAIKTAKRKRATHTNRKT